MQGETSKAQSSGVIIFLRRVTVAAAGLLAVAPGGYAVRFEAKSTLAEIQGDTVIHDVTTWHGQYVDRPGRGVEIVGFAPDGTPEAFEVVGRPFGIGVQWHPETPPWDERHNALFDAYADSVQSVQAATK